MKRLCISFSGGRSSALMARLLLEKPSDCEVVTLFANTGLEHEETLIFVDRCDRNFGFKTIWLECVVNPEMGQGTTHRVVDFYSASRKGQPFESMVRKYGIPNKNFPHCTRVTKLEAMNSYLRSIGWETKTYDTAIGLRADEMDRVSEKWKENRIVYPLLDRGIRKYDVLGWWARQSFDLNLPEHLGNCVTCWKKSDRKLFRIARETPQAFDFMRRMEREHRDTGAGDGGRVFFRHARSGDQMLAEAAHERPDDPQLDLGGGCGDSCEVYADSSDLADAA